MEWGPFEEMRELQKRINKTFESFFNKPQVKSLSVNTYSPLSDVIDKEGYILVKVDPPRVEKEDIAINITNQSIEVRAHKKHEVKIQKKGYYKHERSYGGFYRVIHLPSSVDADSAKAVYKNGVLEINLQKSKTKKISKKVKVE